MGEDTTSNLDNILGFGLSLFWHTVLCFRGCIHSSSWADIMGHDGGGSAVVYEYRAIKLQLTLLNFQKNLKKLGNKFEKTWK